MNLPDIVIAKLEKQSMVNLGNPSDKDLLSLSEQIFKKTETHLGINTLKRLLGTLNDNTSKPRQGTLNAIAKFLGSSNWLTLLIDLSQGSSSFSSVEGELHASTLHVGQMVKVTYMPDRVLLLTYLGDDHFEVSESQNSKLQQGDILSVSSFVLHYPLIARGVTRQEKELGNYTAARVAGLASISVL